ncbi:hypothetical protein UQW22_09205 [Isoptericola halotolerans]|uniref:hypothetical protein n=1 Tax=Isoptericola halotolerans TaxID=300560 RepID=UPI003890E9AF
MPATTAPPTDDRADDRAATPSTRLSGTQILASGLAAVSTTVLLSFFGVAGTIIGAGLASVLTVVANFLYTRSIEKTHAQLKPVVGQIVRPRPGSSAVATGSTAVSVTSAGTVVETDDADGGTTVALDVDGTEAAAPRNAWLRLIDRHGTVRVLAASAAVVFVAVMGVVVAVELMIGKPLADAVQGTEGSGTSISRTDGDDAGSSSRAGTGVDREAPADQRPAGSTTEDSTSSENSDEETTEPTQGPAAEDGPGTTAPTEPAEPEDSGEESTGGSGTEDSTGGSTDEETTGGSTGDETTGGSGTDTPSSGTSPDQEPSSATDGATTG